MTVETVETVVTVVTLVTVITVVKKTTFLSKQLLLKKYIKKFNKLVMNKLCEDKVFVITTFSYSKN